MSGRGRGSRCVALAGCLFLLCLALPRSAFAHLPIEEQIEDLSARIATRPGDATLYLKRGELHRLHGEWRAAKADYRRARGLDPELDVVDLCLGTLRLDEGKPRRALPSLDRFLAAHPDHAEAWLLRGRALARLGRNLEAAQDFTRGLAAFRPPQLPQPESFIERARALAAAGADHVEEAVRGLDEGMAALGPIVSLQLVAIDLQVGSGRYAAALERLDSMAARSPRKDVWLANRGSILESAQRRDEARAAYAEAIEAIEALPPEKRGSASVREIEAGARVALERLTSDPTRPPPEPVP